MPDCDADALMKLALAALAPVLAAVVGCGETPTARDSFFGTPEVFCHAGPTICPSATPTPTGTRTPTRISVEITTATPPGLCYDISGTPCPTETPTPANSDTNPSVRTVPTAQVWE